MLQLYNTIVFLLKQNIFMKMYTEQAFLFPCWVSGAENRSVCIPHPRTTILPLC